MSKPIFLSYVSEDRALAADLASRLIRRFGQDAVVDPHDGSLAAGSSLQQWLATSVRACDSVVVFVSPEWLRKVHEPMFRHEISLALLAGKRLLPVLVDGARMPLTSELPVELHGLSLLNACVLRRDNLDADMMRLLDAVAPDHSVSRASADLGVKWRTDTVQVPPSAGLPSKPQPDIRLPTMLPPSPQRQTGELQAQSVRRPPTAGTNVATKAWQALKQLFSISRTGDSPSPDSKAHQALPREVESNAVYFGVTAPEQCPEAGRFNAVLATYVETARQQVKAKLERLGGEATRPLLDLSPDRQTGWIVGAPVTVRLTATHADVEPCERMFEWNGRENVVAFSVQVHQGVTASAVDLCFHVSLAGVPIALIPLPVALSSSPGTAEVERVMDVRVADSAFASYSSKDAQTVGYCLSTLTRWSPGLSIFQDCLDLRPGDAFKPQLVERIASSDVFLLFWSRNAFASPWVQWEYDTARRTKGLRAVIPMPLEDPKIAPPPPEFADEQMRDRFMMARYALAKVDEMGLR